ncbi:hypothetical protein [Harryflintia acetispora]|uniref:hypothetical protein n=1 Tax=Harryflintia acetispora TaxID=1849041 RepID=UPI002570B7F5|nr:hypothetical protein [Harryflintia acetispora]
MPLPIRGGGAPLPIRGGGAPLPIRGGGAPLPIRGGGAPLPIRGGEAPLAYSRSLLSWRAQIFLHALEVFKKALDFLSPLEYNCRSDRKEVSRSQKKTGRPVSPDSKHTMFRVRLGDDSLVKLEECAKALKTTKSDIVRRGIDTIHDSLKK